MQTPHATPKVLIATTDLERLHQQLERQQDQLARAAALITELWPRHQRTNTNAPGKQTL